MDFPHRHGWTTCRSVQVLLAIFAATAGLHAAAPIVSNVRAEQRRGTQLVDITYDVADADGDKLTVSVAVSDTGGANHLYTVLRSAAVPGGFAPVAEHVLSTPPENVWVDPTATNAPAFFYQLKVE